MKNTLVISAIQALVFALWVWAVASIFPVETNVSSLFMDAMIFMVSALGFFLGFVWEPVLARTVFVGTFGPFASLMVLASPWVDLRSMSDANTLSTLDLVAIMLFVWFTVPCVMRLVLDGLYWCGSKLR